MPDPQVSGERIATLLEEIKSISDARVQARAEELVRLVMELYGAGLERLLRISEQARGAGDDLVAGSGGDLAARISADDLVSSLLALHGIHPVSIEDRIRRGIERVRPYLGSHGGDVELVGVENGEVVLRLKGSCNGCPSSALTLQNAIEGAIEEAAPEIVGIRVEKAPVTGVAETAPEAPLTVLGRDARDLGNAGAATPSNGQRGPRPKWVAIEAAPALAPGEIAGLTIHDASIFLCRLDEGLYAYRDRCPACDSPFAGGQLDRHTLACPTCGHAFDVHRAGQSRQAGSLLHLEPLPLLEDGGTVRIALPQPAEPHATLGHSAAAS